MFVYGKKSAHAIIFLQTDGLHLRFGATTSDSVHDTCFNSDGLRLFFVQILLAARIRAPIKPPRVAILFTRSTIVALVPDNETVKGLDDDRSRLAVVTLPVPSNCALVLQKIFQTNHGGW